MFKVFKLRQEESCKQSSDRKTRNTRALGGYPFCLLVCFSYQ